MPNNTEERRLWYYQRMYDLKKEFPHWTWGEVYDRMVIKRTYGSHLREKYKEKK